MLDWLKNQPLWRSFSELDTLASLVQCLTIGAGVVNGLVAGFGGWLDSQPASIKFVLFLVCAFDLHLVDKWRALDAPVARIH